METISIVGIDRGGPNGTRTSDILVDGDGLVNCE